MTLPQSFLASGFVTPELARRPQGALARRLMIASEGGSDTGKTEFCLSAPGPGVLVACDRGFDAVFDNPKPPKERRQDFGIKVIKMPSPTQFSDAKAYVPYWQEFYKNYMAALDNRDAKTVCVDGDNISWECQRLAEHGKLTGIFPQTRYTDVYAARRQMYFRAWDSSKIIIMTNMMRNEFRVVTDADGNPVMDKISGEPKKEPTGEKVAQGFPDQEYLWQIRIRHLYRPPTFNTVLKKLMGQAWGLRIVKCKVNRLLEGTELWGSDCNFAGLVRTVYPNIVLTDWGF